MNAGVMVGVMGFDRARGGGLPSCRRGSQSPRSFAMRCAPRSSLLFVLVVLSVASIAIGGCSRSVKGTVADEDLGMTDTTDDAAATDDAGETSMMCGGNL